MAERKVVRVGRLRNRAITDKEIEQDWTQYRSLGHACLDVPPRRMDSLPDDTRLSAPKVACQPVNEVRMEVGIADGVEEK